MSALHSHWRDCQAWQTEGLPISTTSNEACKMYDASLTQMVGWYTDPTIGGLENAITGILTADPTCVMGHVLANGLQVMATLRSPVLDPKFQESLDSMVKLAESSNITDREKQHVDAVKLCGDGYWDQAGVLWDTILVDHPTDMLAVKFAHLCYFYQGQQAQMRDSIARVLPRWDQTIPLYGYLQGMYAYTLCENQMYSLAEQTAKKGLSLIPQDGWATHALAHVFEMEGRENEGISLMSSTLKDWSFCEHLACHNYWHWAVFHIEKNEHQGALDIFDAEVAPRATKSGAMLDMSDACAMLFRLEMEGVNVSGRWNDIYETCRPHADDHLLAFNDAHFLMACLGAKQTTAVDKMMDSLREFVKSGHGDNHAVMQGVGIAIMEALVAYDNGDYDRAVELLYPQRYHIVTIGGSHAQRDVFNLFLIHAAMKSSNSYHNKLARHLLTERKMLKQNSPMTDRLVAKVLAQHGD